MKLKIDAFSIFMIFLKWSTKEYMNKFFRRATVDKPLVIKKCPVPSLIMFMMMKLKIDVFSACMIFL